MKTLRGGAIKVVVGMSKDHRESEAMRFCLRNARFHGAHRCAPKYSAMIIGCVVFLAAKVIEAEPAVVGGVTDEPDVGPTIQLSYSRETFESNPISSFMYFVPLISRTSVERETSADNAQEVAVISYERKIAAKYFEVGCDFEIRGTGFHKNTFNPTELIAARTSEAPPDSKLKSLLNYVTFEGEGLGRIEVKGTIDGTSQVVTEVDIRFNVRGKPSPVLVGLYDIEPVDGQYTYENRSNETVARVNTLTFKSGDDQPTMGISVATIKKVGGSEGVVSRFRGAIANLVIVPPKIEPLGNDTLLRLGDAILNKTPEFTFPVAKNLKADKKIEP